MLIQYLLDSTYIVLEYTNTVIHTKRKKQCNGLIIRGPLQLLPVVTSPGEGLSVKSP
jgi:hypothetical protein